MLGGARSPQNEHNLTLFQGSTIFLWCLEGYEIQKLIQEQKSHLNPKYNSISAQSHHIKTNQDE